MKKMSAGMLASAVAALLVVGAAPGCSSTTAPADAGTSDASPSDAATRAPDSAPDAAKSGVDCSANKCSGDPAPNDATKKACADEKAGPCGAQYDNAGTCVNDKVVCGADNKTDQASALKALSDCASEIKAYQECKGSGDGGK